MKHLCPLLLITFALCGGGTGATSEPAGPPLTRAAFDAMDQRINRGNGYKSGTGDEIAWGESYVMLAYTEMYRATGDTKYLDKLVDHADAVLKQRDDLRGFRDYSGRSRPAWSVGGRYTVAELILKNADRRDVLRFRSVPYAFNDETHIRVTPQADGRKFDLAIENPKWPPREDFKGLVMDRESADFIERRVNAGDRVAIDRPVAFSDNGSPLVTVEVIGQATGIPARDGRGEPLEGRSIPMVPLVMAYHGYSGQATHPMLEFASLVRQEPRLRARYGAKADHFVTEAAKVFRDAEEEWRDGPGDGEGYYVFGQRGCPFWADNVGKPFNYLCGEARALVRLAQLTGDKHWENRAKAIARLLKHHLRTTGDGSYVWNYWWGAIEEGWARKDSPSFNTPVWKGQSTVEDTSHGHLEIEFACLCAEAGWVFDEADIRRFAATFLHHVADRRKRTMNDRVDGKAGFGQHDGMVGGWAPLARWEPEVAAVAVEIGEACKLQDQASGSALLSLARLIRWGNR